MCAWGNYCGGPAGNQCVAGSELLGCQRVGNNCDTCALGYLTVPPPINRSQTNEFGTVGKLIEGVGWKITKPGSGSGLSAGDIITHLNGEALHKDLASARDAIVKFGAYEGETVVIRMLAVTGFRFEDRSFERAI